MRWEQRGKLGEQKGSQCFWRSRSWGRIWGEVSPAPKGPGEGFSCDQDSVLENSLGAFSLVICHRRWKGSEILLLTLVCRGVRWFQNQLNATWAACLKPPKCESPWYLPLDAGSKPPITDSKEFPQWPSYRPSALTNSDFFLFLKEHETY